MKMINFDYDGVRSADKVEVHETSQEAAYWTQFYERNDFGEGSSFFNFINSLPELPETVVDIGCGQGRDSLAFAANGKRVVGLDRSVEGVHHAASRAIEQLAEQERGSAEFFACDVSDNTGFSHSLEYARRGDENVCYYMRFFLHSIPEDVQESLMETIAGNARLGDVLAVEFRTDLDEDEAKAFGNSHYRRYQNAAEFSQSLQEKYGWNVVLETESKGLSPYQDEDPVLYRGLAVR